MKVLLCQLVLVTGLVVTTAPGALGRPTEDDGADNTDVSLEKRTLLPYFWPYLYPPAAPAAPAPPAAPATPETGSEPTAAAPASSPAMSPFFPYWLPPYKLGLGPYSPFLYPPGFFPGKKAAMMSYMLSQMAAANAAASGSSSTTSSSGPAGRSIDDSSEQPTMEKAAQNAGGIVPPDFWILGPALLDKLNQSQSAEPELNEAAKSLSIPEYLLLESAGPIDPDFYIISRIALLKRLLDDSDDDDEGETATASSVPTTTAKSSADALAAREKSLQKLIDLAAAKAASAASGKKAKKKKPAKGGKSGKPTDDSAALQEILNDLFPPSRRRRAAKSSPKKNATVSVPLDYWLPPATPDPTFFLSKKMAFLDKLFDQLLLAEITNSTIATRAAELTPEQVLMKQFLDILSPSADEDAAPAPLPPPMPLSPMASKLKAKEDKKASKLAAKEQKKTSKLAAKEDKKASKASMKADKKASKTAAWASFAFPDSMISTRSTKPKSKDVPVAREGPTPEELTQLFAELMSSTSADRDTRAPKPMKPGKAAKAPKPTKAPKFSPMASYWASAAPGSFLAKKMSFLSKMYASTTTTEPTTDDTSTEEPPATAEPIMNFTMLIQANMQLMDTMFQDMLKFKSDVANAVTKPTREVAVADAVLDRLATLKGKLAAASTPSSEGDLSPTTRKLPANLMDLISQIQDVAGADMAADAAYAKREDDDEPATTTTAPPPPPPPPLDTKAVLLEIETMGKIFERLSAIQKKLAKLNTTIARRSVPATTASPVLDMSMLSELDSLGKVLDRLVVFKKKMSLLDPSATGKRQVGPDDGETTTRAPLVNADALMNQIDAMETLLGRLATFKKKLTTLVQSKRQLPSASTDPFVAAMQMEAMTKLLKNYADYQSKLAWAKATMPGIPTEGGPIPFMADKGLMKSMYKQMVLTNALKSMGLIPTAPPASAATQGTTEDTSQGN